MAELPRRIEGLNVWREPTVLPSELLYGDLQRSVAEVGRPTSPLRETEATPGKRFPMQSTARLRKSGPNGVFAGAQTSSAIAPRLGNVGA
jgi:hypothetical protein